jgi:hypothetical protein
MAQPGMTDVSRLRKRPLETDAATNTGAAGEIDIAGCPTIAYSSEDPAHPVEHLLDGNSGPGATRWISARPDTIERILVEFDRPQAISRLLRSSPICSWCRSSLSNCWITTVQDGNALGFWSGRSLAKKISPKREFAVAISPESLAAATMKPWITFPAPSTRSTETPHRWALPRRKPPVSASTIGSAAFAARTAFAS